MSRSLAIAFICSLGLVAFSGCKSDDENPPGGPGGSTGGTAGSGATGGNAGSTGGAAGSSGQGGTPAGSGGGGTGGVTGGMGGAGSGGVGGTGGSSGTGGTGGAVANDGKSWTHLGFDQSNTYHNPYETKITVENASTLVEKWVFPTAGTPHGGLTIAEGKVFATTLGGVYAIDLVAGTQIWHMPSIISEATPTYDNGAIYVHTQGAILYKLNAADGATIWQTAEKTYNLDGADGTSSPVVGGGLVIVGHSAGPNEISGDLAKTATSKGGVEAFNAETGARAWTYNSVEGQEDGAMTWSTVTIDLEMGVVFAATGNNYTVAGPNSDAIHAIDLMDGTLVWKKQVRAGDQWSTASSNSDDTDFGANPILGMIGDRKVVACGDKGSEFWVLDRMTGEIIWSKPELSGSHTAQNGGVLNNGAYDGERFYIASNDPTAANSVVLRALDPDGGADIWPAKTFPKIMWGMQSVANGVLAVPVNNELRLFNAATGEELNMFDTGGAIAAGAPAIADGMIVVKSGLTYLFADLFGTGGQNMEIHAYGLP